MVFVVTPSPTQELGLEMLTAMKGIATGKRKANLMDARVLDDAEARSAFSSLVEVRDRAIILEPGMPWAAVPAGTVKQAEDRESATVSVAMHSQLQSSSSSDECQGGGGMVLESGMDSRCALHGRKRTAQAAWLPGRNCGRFIGSGGRAGRIGEQAQVMLVNGYKRLTILPYRMRSELQKIFRPVGSTAATTVSAQILSGILQVKARTIEATFAYVKRRGFQPAARRRVDKMVVPASTASTVGTAVKQGPAVAVAASAASDGLLTTDVCAAGSAADQVPAIAAVASAASDGPLTADTVPSSSAQLKTPPRGFVNAVRVANYVATHGLPTTAFSDLLHLCFASGGDVGPGPHGRHFCTVLEDTFADHASPAARLS